MTMAYNVERRVILKHGRQEAFMGWARTRRYAKYLAEGESVGRLFVFGIMAKDIEPGTTIYHGHELPAWIIDV